MKFLRRCALLALLVLPTLARAADIAPGRLLPEEAGEAY